MEYDDHIDDHEQGDNYDFAETYRDVLTLAKTLSLESVAPKHFKKYEVSKLFKAFKQYEEFEENKEVPREGVKDIETIQSYANCSTLPSLLLRTRAAQELGRAHKIKIRLLHTRPASSICILCVFKA